MDSGIVVCRVRGCPFTTEYHHALICRGHAVKSNGTGERGIASSDKVLEFTSDVGWVGRVKKVKADHVRAVVGIVGQESIDGPSTLNQLAIVLEDFTALNLQGYTKGRLEALVQGVVEQVEPLRASVMCGLRGNHEVVDHRADLRTGERAGPEIPGPRLQWCGCLLHYLFKLK